MGNSNSNSGTSTTRGSYDRSKPTSPVFTRVVYLHQILDFAVDELIVAIRLSHVNGVWRETVENYGSGWVHVAQGIAEQGGFAVSYLYACQHDFLAWAIRNVIVKGKLDPNINFWNTKTALFVASKAGKIEVVKALLESGANPNPVSGTGIDKGGFNPLFLAVEKNDLALARALIEAGATDDHRGGGGASSVTVTGVAYSSAVMMAAALGESHSEMLRLLVASGFASHTNSNGQTPLFVCAETSNVTGIKTLVQAGCDVKERNSHTGDSLLHVAQSADVVRLLIEEFGLDPTDKNPSNGNTPLMAAAVRLNGNRVAVGALLETYSRRSSISRQQQQGLSPQLDVNEQNEYTGMTALHLAALKDDSVMIATLIDHGARTDIFDWFGDQNTVYAPVDPLGRHVMLTPRSNRGILLQHPLNKVYMFHEAAAKHWREMNKVNHMKLKVDTRMAVPRGGAGRLPLHCCLEAGGYSVSVGELVRRGTGFAANVDVVTRGGNASITPAMLACMHGSAASLSILLEAGARIDDLYFQIARCSGVASCVEVLEQMKLKRKQDPTLLSKQLQRSEPSLMAALGGRRTRPSSVLAAAAAADKSATTAESTDAAIAAQRRQLEQLERLSEDVAHFQEMK